MTHFKVEVEKTSSVEIISETTTSEDAFDRKTIFLEPINRIDDEDSYVFTPKELRLFIKILCRALVELDEPLNEPN